MDRATFLTRVREAAASGRRHLLTVPPVPADAGYVGCQGDPCETLAAEIRGAGGSAQIVDTWTEAHESIARLFDVYQPRSLLRWQHPFLRQAGLDQLCESRGISVDDWETLTTRPVAEQRERILAAGVGITSVDWALAETGTLVVRATPGRERVCSLVPPVHIALVGQSQILPDLFDLFRELAAAGYDRLPSNLALITGPSKTGDIELELTTGVHGPGQWQVVIVRQA